MRVVLFLNGPVGAKVARYLSARRDVEIVGLVIHPKHKRRAGEQILGALKLPATRVFDGSKLDQSSICKRIAALKPDMGVSVYFLYILRQPLLKLFPRGCVNLHPAYLPWNRGTYTNVWSIIDRSPAGATLHTIDEGVDTGKILARAKEPIKPTDTGETLYARLEQASFRLFKKSWPKLASGKLKPQPQPRVAKSAHRFCDVNSIDVIDLNKRYIARELIDIIRARTFPPYSGAYFLHKGRKVYLRLSLSYE